LQNAAIVAGRCVGMDADTPDARRAISQIETDRRLTSCTDSSPCNLAKLPACSTTADAINYALMH